MNRMFSHYVLLFFLFYVIIHKLYKLEEQTYKVHAVTCNLNAKRLLFSGTQLAPSVFEKKKLIF